MASNNSKSNYRDETLKPEIGQDIDTPFFDIHNEAGLSDEVHQAKSLGFTAKAATHPAQVSTINRTFTPTDAEIAHARAVLAENAKGWAS